MADAGQSAGDAGAAEAVADAGQSAGDTGAEAVADAGQSAGDAGAEITTEPAESDTLWDRFVNSVQSLSGRDESMEPQCLFANDHLIEGLVFNGSEISIDTSNSDEWGNDIPEIILNGSGISIDISNSDEWWNTEIILMRPEGFFEEVNLYAFKSVPSIFSDENMSSVWLSGLSGSKLKEEEVGLDYNAIVSHVVASYIYKSTEKYIELCPQEEMQNDACRVRVLYSGNFYMISKGKERKELSYNKGPLTARIYFGSRLLDFSSCAADPIVTALKTDDSTD